MFLWRTDQSYPSIIIKDPPYLFFCSKKHFDKRFVVTPKNSTCPYDVIMVNIVDSDERLMYLRNVRSKKRTIPR